MGDGHVVKALAEIEIIVESESLNSSDVIQAVQDAIGHTGAIVSDVTVWERVA